MICGIAAPRCCSPHPRVIMEILGHSQISVTMNLYAHVIPAMQKKVAAQMDAILSPPPTDKGKTAANNPVGTIN